MLRGVLGDLSRDLAFFLGVSIDLRALDFLLDFDLLPGVLRPDTETLFFDLVFRDSGRDFLVAESAVREDERGVESGVKNELMCDWERERFLDDGEGVGKEKSTVEGPRSNFLIYSSYTTEKLYTRLDALHVCLFSLYNSETMQYIY